ncbi:hypothetical protein FH972_025599 [Carpinus fangiana]|uniref:Amidohydrolase-related domain-containing protein n=1 Tax=Carpinus fangiana TaxID=176857 RepID=A0A5N6L2H4_9ROSI|nr:hypothetical protein FH972_025599 [Carpinus fangiana]
MFPLITLEEHFLSQSFESDAAVAQLYAAFPPRVLESLRDLEHERIIDMDDGGVAVQVISHGPGAGTPQQCHSANNDLAAAIRKNPARLRGFAALSMGDAKTAAEELRRCVNTHEFVGALIENSTEGRHYDDEVFWPVFEAAQELDVPLYIHPAFPEGDLKRHYQGNYDEKTAYALGAFGWGWHVDTGLHVLKLYAAGVFDRFPRLKIVIGHMGEALPFQFSRIVRSDSRDLFGPHEKKFQQVWDENIWITTSGMFDLAPMSCLLRTAKIDRIMFSVDYPFSRNKDGADFMATLEASGLISNEQLGLIAHQNAEKLLGVRL